MATAVSMPSLGMTMEEGTVIEWPLSVGDAVASGDIILIIESEKTEVEIEAPATGFFRHVYIEEGETVPCGTLLAALTQTADEPFDAKAFHVAEDRPAVSADRGLQVKSAARPAGTATATTADKPIAPAARATAKKLGIDPARVPGTGPNGRVTKQDVEAFATARDALTAVGDGVSIEVL
ncbi:MAG: hypothetical protein GY944_09300, partial [bacterium]|nr:hypothetical protein [bacterium]